MTRAEILAKRERQNAQPLTWPNSRLGELQPARLDRDNPATYDRLTYDSQQFLSCYRNLGMYPVSTDLQATRPFYSQPTRRSRRQSGQVKHRMFAVTSPRALRVAPTPEQKAQQRESRLAHRRAELHLARANANAAA